MLSLSKASKTNTKSSTCGHRKGLEDVASGGTCEVAIVGAEEEVVESAVDDEVVEVVDKCTAPWPISLSSRWNPEMIVCI